MVQLRKIGSFCVYQYTPKKNLTVLPKHEKILELLKQGDDENVFFPISKKE